MTKRREYFTLVELLVVVAILGILVAILMPALVRAKETAQLTACTSNLKQVGVAHAMYGNDNDDHIVPLFRHSSEFGYSMTYNTGLREYGLAELQTAFGNPRYLSCTKWDPPGRYENWGQNFHVGITSWGSWTSMNVGKFNRLTRASELIFLFPAVTVDFRENSFRNLGQPGRSFPSPTNHMPRFTAGRAGGYSGVYGCYGIANVLLFDGHVESIRWNDDSWDSTNIKP